MRKCLCRGTNIKVVARYGSSSRLDGLYRGKRLRSLGPLTLRATTQVGMPLPAEGQPEQWEEARINTTTPKRTRKQEKPDPNPGAWAAGGEAQGRKGEGLAERNPRERGEKAQLEGARASGQMERTEGQRTDSPEGGFPQH